MTPGCDCGAATEGKWDGIHTPDCAVLKSEKCKYWWSDDYQWFCICVDDGVNKATVSLTPEQAHALAGEASEEFRQLLILGWKNVERLLEARRS